MPGRFLTAFILFFSFALPGQATGILEQATIIARMSSYQDGPNCFNTSLLSLGYTRTQVYTSSAEIEHYLKHHCQEIPLNLKKLEPETLLTYSEDGYLVHSAVAVSKENILEKNSLYGSKHHEVFGDPAPGKYLLHPVKQSAFFSQIGKKENAHARAYRCQNATQVSVHQTQFESDDSIRRLKEFLTFIGTVQKIQNPTDLAAKMNSELLQKFKSLRISEALEASSSSTQKESYRLSLAESLAYQWNLLNCSDAYVKYDE
ncbi:hypothetical protein EZJ49_15245 [Bdellovibrio bacteriovorus]|uniref:hypothetical protein n=1 Tax=Bdellovibrio bacteriovorus TaxID=959 RepID=UPI0021D3A04D|nr:hypothetical protein [Bdellovibrio bacteriovorus]UXR64423.1 hypothetical protein EZJ49_15245 [Bdellovibrio bacteriovorus]